MGRIASGYGLPALLIVAHQTLCEAIEPKSWVTELHRIALGINTSEAAAAEWLLIRAS